MIIKNRHIVPKTPEQHEMAKKYSAFARRPDSFKRFKMYPMAWLIFYRWILVVSMVLFCWTLTKIIMIGHDLDKPIVGWRRKAMYLNCRVTGIFMLIWVGIIYQSETNVD
jgi:hypothetical protein